MNNKKIAHLLTLFGVMFLSLIVYLTVFDITSHDDYAVDIISDRENYVIRGSVYDRNKTVLAESTEANGQRSYPHGNLYCHIIGYKSPAYGSNEIEKYYNSDLIGKSSTPIIGGAVTFAGDVQSAIGGKKDPYGYDITLTIDHNLQKTASDALGSYKGSVVVINPKTGEILAMVSKPDFDPSANSLGESIKKATENGDKSLLRRSTLEAYPPGSTFKLIVAAAMIENGCEDFTFDDKDKLTVKVKNYGEGEGKFLGETNLEQGFIHSSNIYFSEAGINLGKDKITDMAKSFMFENEITLDRLGVATSRLPDSIDTNGEITNLCLGQGDVKATPLHLALAASAVANDGIMMTPYIVDSISGPAGIKNTPRKLKQCIKKSTAASLKLLMKKCAQSGTATAASVWGKDVCGKTGTAEIDTDKNTAHALFVGFAPYDDPEIAICVVVENLPHKNTGRRVAAPIAQKVFRKYFVLN